MEQKKAFGLKPHVMGKGKPLSPEQALRSAQAKSAAIRKTKVTLDTPDWAKDHPPAPSKPDT